MIWRNSATGYVSCEMSCDNSYEKKELISLQNEDITKCVLACVHACVESSGETALRSCHIDQTLCHCAIHTVLTGPDHVKSYKHEV